MSKIKKLTISALLLTSGLLLPILTGQIPAIGNMLLPMHIPVLICGFLCGRKFGLIVGFILPLLKSFIFEIPILYPIAISMSFEMATYGFISGFLFSKAPSTKLTNIYCSLIPAMIIGRTVFGITQLILLNIVGNSFTFSAFISAVFFNSIPGIILQLIIIPIIINNTQVFFAQHNYFRDNDY